MHDVKTVQLIIGVAFLSTTLIADVVTIPSVRYADSSIVGVVPQDHKALGRSMEIIESEGCAAQRTSANSVNVSNRCDFLRGVFSYRRIDPATSVREQVFVGFALSRKSPRSYTFMVSGPMIASFGSN